LIDNNLKVPYHYDYEKIIFIQDSFTKDFTSVEKGLVTTPLSWIKATATILVGDEGGGSNNATACNASMSTNVEPGKTYQLRFIGATPLIFTSLAIEHHDHLEVIEADG
jgi:L-ascorbate oxidase